MAATSDMQQRMAQASAAYANMFATTSIVNRSNEYPKFRMDEVTVGPVLGKGGFGTVSEVRAFNATMTEESESMDQDYVVAVSKQQNRNSSSFRSLYDDTETDLGELESRKFIADHCLRTVGGDARYAIKVLSPSTKQNPALFLQGVIDMAVEAHVLSSLEHPNIVKMRALAKCSPFDGNFFIVMDRLYDTLEKRLETWRVRHMRTSGMAGRLTDRKGKRKNELYEERIVAAFDLAAAVTYLHDKKVLYRDIKPENVGFDIRGDIKIFDFGLAKELKDTDKNADGTYNLTETTGSPRYMAPEIANSKPYNATCDVYSFAILFWEMLALKLPYEMYTNKSLIEHVYNGRCSRPTINPTWPSAIKVLLQRAWAQDWKERPPMEQVTAMLKTEAARVRDGDDSGLEHMRRRSTHVFRPVDNKGGVLQAARVR